MTSSAPRDRRFHDSPKAPPSPSGRGRPSILSPAEWAGLPPSRSPALLRQGPGGAMPLTPQLESRRSAEMQMLLLLPLLWLGRSVLGELVDLEEMGELGELGAEEELDLSDFDLDIVSYF